VPCRIPGGPTRARAEDACRPSKHGLFKTSHPRARFDLIVPAVLLLARGVWRIPRRQVWARRATRGSPVRQNISPAGGFGGTRVSSLESSCGVLAGCGTYVSASLRSRLALASRRRLVLFGSEFCHRALLFILLTHLCSVPDVDRNECDVESAQCCIAATRGRTRVKQRYNANMEKRTRRNATRKVEKSYSIFFFSRNTVW